MEETVSVAGLTVKNQVFGLAKDSFSQPMAIFGTGFEENESYVTNNGGKAYPTFVSNLVEQGIIKSRLFSITMSGESKLI